MASLRYYIAITFMLLFTINTVMAQTPMKDSIDVLGFPPELRAIYVSNAFAVLLDGAYVDCVDDFRDLPGYVSCSSVPLSKEETVALVAIVIGDVADLTLVSNWRREDETTLAASWLFEDGLPLTVLVADMQPGPGSFIVTFVQAMAAESPPLTEVTPSALAAFSIAMILTVAVSGSPDHCCTCPEGITADLPFLCFSYVDQLENAVLVVDATMEGLGFYRAENWVDQSGEDGKAQVAAWEMVDNTRLIVALTDANPNGKLGLILLQAN